MSLAISISTIYLCTAIAGLVSTVGLTLQWLHDRRERSTGWWAISLGLATVAMVMLSTRGYLPHWFAVGLANALSLTAFAMCAAGYALFIGWRPRIGLVLLAPAIWLSAYFGFEGFRESLVARMSLLTAVMTVCSLLIVRFCWAGWKKERLPTFLVAIAVYGLHSMMHFARLLLGMTWSSREINGQIDTPWIATVGLATFALVVMSSFVALALVKERTERRYKLAAEIDGLTSAHSRRYFVAEVRAQLARKPTNGVLSVIDLDFFKSVNDTYGHMAGDRVLESFGRLVRRRLGQGMVFGRLGGEEFGLFLAGMNEEASSAFLDSLRQDVAAMSIPFMGNSLRVTASIGAAPIEDVGSDFDHLMAAADNALYVAKEEGRDQVRVFTPSMRLRKIVEADGEESRVSLAKARVSRISVRNTFGTD